MINVIFYGCRRLCFLVSMFLCLTLPIFVNRALAATVYQTPAGPEIRFYVSTLGNDSWSGNLESPNQRMTDGPFRTFVRAKAQVLLEKSRHPNCNFTIFIRQGTYYLMDPILFRPEDSASDAKTITYAAFPGEIPVLSGGRLIDGEWAPSKRDPRIWELQIADVAAGKWYFQQLFVNCSRRRRASSLHLPHGEQLPRDPEAYLRMEKTLFAGESPINKMGFVYRDKDFDPAWHDLEEVQVVIFYAWNVPRKWIDAQRSRKPESIQKHELFFTSATNRPTNESGGGKDEHQRYYFDNLYEGLKEPGQWYLDRKTGVLSYFPLPGEDMDSAQVIAPFLSRIMEFQGEWAANRYIKNVNFSNLSFQHAAWQQSRTEIADFQAAQWLRNGAIYMESAENITFSHCEIAHVGEYGIVLKQAAKNNLIEHCEIHDLGAGGLVIGELGTINDKPNPTLESVAHNTVHNCRVYDGGHVFANGVGIVIAKSSYNSLIHNEVFDFYYSGISVGMQWRGPPSTSNHNLIQYNHVHHVGRGVLGDLGGIYVLDNPETTVANNLIHDIVNYKLTYGGFGIYLDKNSGNVTVENNIVYKTNSAALMTNCCREATVRNNIFAFSKTEGLIRRAVCPDVVSSWNITRNILFNHQISPSGMQKWQGDASSLIWGSWKDKENFQLNNNIYYVTGNDLRQFYGKTFEEWKNFSGQDSQSIFADPLFSDIDRLDFSLKSDSPAWNIGFKPIMVNHIGTYGW